MSSKDSKIAAAQAAYGKDFAELEDIAKQWQAAFDAAERQAEKAKTAAREGGDYFHGNWSLSASVFQSTPPRGGGDHFELAVSDTRAVSIHAPPRGGRLPMRRMCPRSRTFQSMPPARGATIDALLQIYGIQLSIHAPARGGDYLLHICSICIYHFNPRPPRGGRPPPAAPRKKA